MDSNNNLYKNFINTHKKLCKKTIHCNLAYKKITKENPGLREEILQLVKDNQYLDINNLAWLVSVKPSVVRKILRKEGISLKKIVKYTENIEIIRKSAEIVYLRPQTKQ